jgi:hypothetical protein
MDDNRYDKKLNISTKFNKGKNYSFSKDKTNEQNKVENAIDYISGDDFPTTTSHKFNRNTREQE